MFHAHSSSYERQLCICVMGIQGGPLSTPCPLWAWDIEDGWGFHLWLLLLSLPQPPRWDCPCCALGHPLCSALSWGRAGDSTRCLPRGSRTREWWVGSQYTMLGWLPQELHGGSELWELVHISGMTIGWLEFLFLISILRVTWLHKAPDF